MKRFQFRLKKLLDIRRYEEREWEIKLAKVTGACINLENRIENNYVESRRSLKERAVITDLEWQRALSCYQQRLEQNCGSLKEELEHELLTRAGVEQEYLAASRKRKALAKLEDKQEAAYFKQQKREEVKALDEMGLRKGGENNASV